MGWLEILPDQLRLILRRHARGGGHPSCCNKKWIPDSRFAASGMALFCLIGRCSKSIFLTHRAILLQFLKFGTVGFAGFFVDLGFFHLGLDVLGLNHYASALFSFPFAATFTWAGNRFFTFRGKNEGSAHAQWMRFLTVSACGLVLNRGTFSLCTAVMPLVYEHPVLGLLAGTGAGMFFNFFFARKLVFR